MKSFTYRSTHGREGLRWLALAMLQHQSQDLGLIPWDA